MNIIKLHDNTLLNLDKVTRIEIMPTEVVVYFIEGDVCDEGERFITYDKGSVPYDNLLKFIESFKEGLPVLVD